MALKPTIFKFDVAINDLNRNYFDIHSLTLACHPSETCERMMVRLLAYCLNMGEGLNFTAGLSTPDEPDIEQLALNGERLLWLDVGEPKPERLKKALRVAKRVNVYAFNTKADIWWQQNAAVCTSERLAVYQFNWSELQALATLCQRNMSFSLTVSENSLYIANDSLDLSLELVTLQAREGEVF